MNFCRSLPAVILGFCVSSYLFRLRSYVVRRKPPVSWVFLCFVPCGQTREELDKFKMIPPDDSYGNLGKQTCMSACESIQFLLIFVLRV